MGPSAIGVGVPNELGALLPDTTGDETDEGWNEKEGDTRDDEMRRDVPPHHGD